MSFAQSDQRYGDDEVRRSRLLNGLARLPAGGVALLRAPAGSGKTILLAQFAHATRCHGRAAVDPDGRDLERTAAPAPASTVRGRCPLLRSLADDRRPTDIVLDQVDPSHRPLVNQLVTSVAGTQDAGMRLYLASRHDLSLGILDLRLRNRVLEYDPGTLALDAGELAALAEAHGVDPARVEPWIPLLRGWAEPSARLCRLLRAGVPCIDDLVAACDDLFAERLMGQLGQPARTFLMRVAVAEAPSIALAHELTGIDDCEAVFGAMAAAGVPLGRAGADTGGWLLHPLFRHFLLRAAERTTIDTGRLHAIAFRHLGSKGRPADALRHAVESSRGRDAVDLIERAGGWRMVMRGVSPDLVAALDRVSIEHAAEAPRAVLGKAFYLAKRGHTAESRVLMRCLEARCPTPSGPLQPPDPLAADFQLVDTHIGIYEDRAMDGADEARLHAAVAALEPGDTFGRALALNHLCAITLHLGEFALSQRYGESAMRLYEDAGARFGALHLHAHLGQIRLARGDLDGAEREYELMATRARSLPHSQGELEAIAQALSAEVAYEIDDIPRCQTLLERALRSVEGSDAWLDVLAATYRVSARLAFLKSSTPGALSALAHAEQTAIQKNMPRLLRLIRIERIRAFTLSDELEKAAEEIQAAGLAGNIEATGAVDEADWAMRQGSTAVTLARFLTRSRRAEQALALLGQAEKRALRGGQMLAVAKLRVLRATAHWQLRQRSEAIQALCDSIRLLGKQAFRRFILDEGPPALAILQAALDKGRLVGGLNPQVRKKLAELNHRFTVGDLEPRRVPVRRRRARHPQQQADLRSPHYIQLLATGLSNKEIARTLGVSPNTVKYHLKRIFSELHVDSRNRAVFRARELGIIDS